MVGAQGLKFQGLGASGLEVERVHPHLKSSKPQKAKKERNGGTFFILRPLEQLAFSSRLLCRLEFQQIRAYPKGPGTQIIGF